MMWSLISYLIGVIVTFFISRYLSKKSSGEKGLTCVDFYFCLFFTSLSWLGLFCVICTEIMCWFLTKEWRMDNPENKLPPKWFR